MVDRIVAAAEADRTPPELLASAGPSRIARDGGRTSREHR